jgi:hypothetical protein
MTTKWIVVLALVVAGCVHLPVEQTTPALGPYMAAGAALDVGLQVAKRPLWQRVGVSTAIGLTIRYSTCCRRPEGAHFGLLWGASFGEFLGLAKKLAK